MSRADEETEKRLKEAIDEAIKYLFRRMHIHRQRRDQHAAKIEAAEEAGKKVNRRTYDAWTNNRQKADYYEREAHRVRQMKPDKWLDYLAEVERKKRAARAKGGPGAHRVGKGLSFKNQKS